MNIEKTIALIKTLHENQFDWAGNPYWTHPVAVMNLLPSNSSLDQKLIALLHDVIEDCSTAIGRSLGVAADSVSSLIAAQFLLDQGYSDYVVQGVKLLTRTKNGVSYLKGIQNIADSGHLDAVWVKLCDNTHNTDPDRSNGLSPEDKIRVEQMSHRYERSKEILKKAIIASISDPFVYIDLHGEVLLCEVTPKSIRYGSTEGHANREWLLCGIDRAQNVERDFVISEILLVSGRST